MYVKQSKALRTFHNRIKQILLNQYATDASVLVDIGVGRGGDIFKWSRCKVRRVIAYDVDHISVKEAIKRYETACLVFDYKFYTCASLDAFVDTHLREMKGTIPIVSCQFAIHYFFETEYAVDNFMTNVYKLLSPGGVLVGTFMNGDEICRLTNNLKEPFSNKNLLIQPTSTEVADFGAKIDVYLTDTLYFGEHSVSAEYLVKPNVLIDKGRQHGLTCIELDPFKSYYAPEVNLSDQMQITSFSYSTFVFKKEIS